MRAEIEGIADYLSDKLDGVKVKTAYDGVLLERPVTSPSVYVTIDDSVLSGTLDFIIYAYSPVSQGGIGCIELAEKTSHLLQECEAVTIGGLSISRISYNSSSNGFVIQIKGSVFDLDTVGEPPDGGAFSISAFDFAYDREMELHFMTSNVALKSVFSPYPIMTICDGIPIDVVGEGTVYKITLQNLSRDMASKLCSNGSFSMKIESGASVEEFRKCFADSRSFDTDNLDKGITVIVAAYDKKGEDE